jgi:hypothetical protein
MNMSIGQCAKDSSLKWLSFLLSITELATTESKNTGELPSSLPNLTSQSKVGNKWRVRGTPSVLHLN